jgi:hypothetical protein
MNIFRKEVIYIDLRDCRAIWFAALCQFVDDCLTNRSDKETVKSKKENWGMVYRFDRDFQDLCMNAGCSPGYVKYFLIKSKEDLKKYDRR